MEKTSTVMNPWPGLASYSGEDGRTLYGRSREINEVYSLIRNNLFITLYGRSGIGKTSLIKAGVSPYLKRSGYMPVYVRLAQEIRKEGEMTFAGCLVRSIREAAAKSHITLEESPTVPDYLSPDALWQWLVSANLITENGDRIVPVIFLDQFEEVFSVDNMESILLLRQLCALVDGKRRLPEGVDGMSSRVRIVVSMRDDSLYRIEDVIDAYNLFPLRQKRYTLKPFGEKASVEVISKPVEGLVSEEVMSQIIEKVGGMGSGGGTDPAVLSLMMSELFKKSAGGPITSDLVAGMDNEIVDSFYREGTRSIPDKEMEFLETHLVTSDGRRSVVAAADLCKNVTQQHLESLLDSHILARLERGSFIDYELSHDVLCKRVAQNKLERERRNAKKRRRHIVAGLSFAVLFLLCIIAAGVWSYSEIARQRDRAEMEKTHAEDETKRANKEKNNAELANKYLLLANDSIRTQSAHLRKAYYDLSLLQIDLAQSNANLVKINHNLQDEKDRVVKTNWTMLENQSCFVAEKALSLCEKGDNLLAQRLLCEVLPKDLEKKDRPYVAAAEGALRKALESNSGILKGHTDDVYSAAFSPDGKRIVSTSEDKTIRIWDAVSGVCLKTLEGHTGGVHSAAFSPDGRRIASASNDKTIRIWDAVSGECLKTLEGHSCEVNSACFSPDGNRIVTASNDKTIRIWDAVGGKCLMILKGHSLVAESARFSPDGNRIVSSSGDGTVRIWDAESGECLKTLKVHSYYVYSASFSPDGNDIVSASRDGTVGIWNVVSGRCLKAWEGHSDFVKSVGFSPDGKLIVSASWDGTVRIWDAESGECLKTLEGHSREVESASFSPDGKRVVSASYDKTVRIWDAVSDECMNTLEGHSNRVYSANFSPDDKRILSASCDGTIRIWDAENGECMKIFEEQQDCVKSANFSPDGNRIVSVLSGGHIRILDAVSGECPETWKRTLFANSASFSPDGKRIVLALWDGKVHIWDAVSGKCLKILEGHSSEVESANFSPDGKRIVSASNDKTIRIWDAVSGKCLKTLEGHFNFVLSACFSSDGNRIVSSSEDGTVRIWDAESGECLKTLEGHSGNVESAVFSLDVKRIVSASNDKTVRIWDTESGECLKTLEGHSNSVNSACFSPDGKRIVSASSDGTVRIWDFPPLQDLLDKTREKFKNNPLTQEEREKYYLQ